MAQLTSRLWKAGLLALNSSYFPQLVRVAAWHEGKEYTDALLRQVAADSDLAAALDMEVGGSVDEALAQLAVTDGARLDGLIVAAVQAYQEVSA